MKRAKILGVVLAGGKGERLHPLTKERSKPAVPFGGKYRIVDFVLSNFINSGILSLYVMVQYLSQSLIEYLRMSWRGVGLVSDHFITVVPPQMRLGENWYRGTADAVRQNLNLIRDFNPDLVAVFGADHVYRMDIQQMLEVHLTQHAHVTVAAIPAPLRHASQFGVIEADSKGWILGFEEKPVKPKPMPGSPQLAYSSMGNYIFDAQVLVEILSDDKSVVSELDFGRTILPRLHRTHRLYAYNFSLNELPGIRGYEEKGYWRDVGNIEAYWKCHMDLLGPKPRFDLDNRLWPIHAARYDGPSAKVLGGEVQDCILGDGSLVMKSKISRSVLGRGVHVREDCIIEDSILLDFVEIGPGSRLKRVIVDRFNTLPAHSEIGFHPKKDAERYFVDASGIVVIPRGRTQ